MSEFMKYSLIEFFCGCGGTSRGFMRSGRFNVILGNDVKKEALRTFEHNHRNEVIKPEVILEDIRKLDISIIENVLKEKGINKGQLDCMIGGPPCQGFSQLRRSEYRDQTNTLTFGGYSKLSEDPRNDLVLRYLEIAAALRPKVLVIENVPQMLSHGFQGRLGKLSEIVINILEKDLGYTVEVAKVNAADYGVPQLRERAFFIASLVGKVSFPSPTHTDPKNKKLIEKGLLPWVTVHDAIGDLPSPSIKENFSDLNKVESDFDRGENSYLKEMRTSKNLPLHHVTRKYNDNIVDIIRHMKPGETWVSESNRMRKAYDDLVEKLVREKELSYSDAKDELIRKGVINPAFYKDYYWSAYTRLAWDQPALTITANSNFLGSGRFTHPVENRGITMREAARLQSFDDDFEFITSDTGKTRIGVGMDMIGEAVPPLLSKAIANHIASVLDSAKNQK